jgi:hypothetical protein
LIARIPGKKSAASSTGFEKAPRVEVKGVAVHQGAEYSGSTTGPDNGGNVRTGGVDSKAIDAVDRNGSDEDRSRKRE